MSYRKDANDALSKISAAVGTIKYELGLLNTLEKHLPKDVEIRVEFGTRIKTILHHLDLIDK